MTGRLIHLKIMICCKCDDKWFMDDDYEHTNPEVAHCENCGASGGQDIRFVQVKADID